MPKSFAAALTTSDEDLIDPASKASGRGRLARDVPKRGFDLATVSLCVVLLLPLLATVALLLLLLQGRPVLIRHRRVGRHGASFGCFKFRTMAVDGNRILQEHLDADPDARIEWEATRKLKNDPRVTPMGRVLRRTSLDELPQFLNVLRGEMSLVGPRPIVQDEVSHYGTRIALYHSVRPGLTGPWQVGGRSDTSYSRRVELDAEYAANWSFGRDLVLLARTVPAVLSTKGSY